MGHDPATNWDAKDIKDIMEGYGHFTKWQKFLAVISPQKLISRAYLGE